MFFEINTQPITKKQSLSDVSGIFHLPVETTSFSTLTDSLIYDLELSVVHGDKEDATSNIPLSHHLTHPRSQIAKEILNQSVLRFSSDPVFLKTQQKVLIDFYQKSKNEPLGIFLLDEIWKSWKEIKDDSGFKEKYQYMDWPPLEQLNRSEWFLQWMSVYNLSSPVISLLVPLFLLLIPFFVIRMKGLKLSFEQYKNVLKAVSSNHALGKIFVDFGSITTKEKLYILVSMCFYVLSIYQNVISCFKFLKNMKKIHEFIFQFRDYLRFSLKKMDLFETSCCTHATFDKFKEELMRQKDVLNTLLKELEGVSSYTMNLKKIFEIGHTLKVFYAMYNDPLYNEALMYSFGFNGYIENIHGLMENWERGQIKPAVFLNSKEEEIKKVKKLKESGNLSKKEKQDKKKKGIPNLIKGLYHGALEVKDAIKNDVSLDINHIITGPNASGKTTLLKSTLTNLIFAQQWGWGFFESAQFEPFASIHCYLNIPDTSGRDSLFQAEARRCKEIIDLVKNTTPTHRHFCVFDELYSGTNPEEAILGANAFMEYMVKHKKVVSMLTTHFYPLCENLEKNKRIQNGHMKVLCNVLCKEEEKGICEEENVSNQDFIFTYKWVPGISRQRGGIKILKDMNYPQEILDNIMENMEKNEKCEKEKKKEK
jgi:hypothetical protein